MAGASLVAMASAQPNAHPAEPHTETDVLSKEEEQILEEAVRASALPSFWSATATLRAAGGYRDNVLLSPFNPVSAPLISVGADVMVNRLPTDGTEVTLLATGDYTAFLDAPETEPEALALVQAGVTRELGSRWKGGLAGEYVFLHQVFDLSVTEAELSTVAARGNTFTLTPSASLDLGRGWSLNVESDGTRQLFPEPLDNYWEVKPLVALARPYGGGLEFWLGYRFGDRWYDTRAPLDAEGDPLPGLLEFTAHEIELRPTVYWDAPRHWRTQFRLGWLYNDDNGGGYFDFIRLAAGANVRYQSGPWTLRVEGQARWYSYPVQRAEGPDSSLRHRTDLAGLVRGEFKASRKLRLFLQYERNTSEDNSPDASYRASGLVTGVEWDL